MPSNNDITFTATSQDAKKRLDVFLSEKLPGISRSQIKKIILNKEISVNNKPTSVHCFLKEGDHIKRKTKNEKLKAKTPSKKTQLLITDHKLPITGKKISLAPASKSGKPFKKVTVISDNPDFLIIEKPAGILVHPTDKEETDTLVDLLTDKYPELKKIGEDPARASIVHRLDKEVSGLMIVPRTQDAFDYFKQQFKNHTIVKKYSALVIGEIAADSAEINFPISRSSTKQGLFAARPNSEDNEADEGKKALTIFKVVKRYKNYTLLEVQILTGRTHQIRVHLLAYGHPIVGDKLYKARKQKIKSDPDRIFLHAGELSFAGPDGKQYHFESNLPPELQTFLATLKG